MMRICTLSCALSLSVLVSGANAQSVRESFESYPAGGLPGGGWLDASERVEGHEILPTAFVIDTVDAHGQPTRAVQTRNVFGNSQGILLPIEEAPVQTIEVDVRVDETGNGASWPMAIGFTQNDGSADINGSPQVLLYAWIDQRWHFFVANGPGGMGQDFIVPAPLFEIGRWYRLILTVDHERRIFDTRIVDAATNQTLGGGAVQLLWWDKPLDTISLFDGDIDDTGTIGTSASVDNVAYEPRNAVCPGDCDASMSIDFGDLVSILFEFGGIGPASCDADGSGTVDFQDLVTSLFAFGECE